MAMYKAKFIRAIRQTIEVEFDDEYIRDYLTEDGVIPDGVPSLDLLNQAAWDSFYNQEEWYNEFNVPDEVEVIEGEELIGLETIYGLIE